MFYSFIVYDRQNVAVKRYVEDLNFGEIKYKGSSA